MNATISKNIGHWLRQRLSPPLSSRQSFQTMSAATILFPTICVTAALSLLIIPGVHLIIFSEWWRVIRQICKQFSNDFVFQRDLKWKKWDFRWDHGSEGAAAQWSASYNHSREQTFKFQTGHTHSFVYPIPTSPQSSTEWLILFTPVKHSSFLWRSTIIPCRMRPIIHWYNRQRLPFLAFR